MLARLGRPLLLGLLHLRNRYFLLMDLVILGLAPALALWLRLDGIDAVLGVLSPLLLYTVLAGGVRLAIFFFFDLYGRYWRYASVGELAQVILAVAVSSLAVIGLFFTARALGEVGPTYSLNALPRSLPFISSLLILVLVGGNRFTVRLADRLVRRRGDGPVVRVAAMGAGDAGAMMVREMKNNPQLGMGPGGLLRRRPGQARRAHPQRARGRQPSGHPPPGQGAQIQPGDHRHAHGAGQRDPGDRGHLRAGRGADQDHPRHLRTPGRHGGRQPTAGRGHRRSGTGDWGSGAIGHPMAIRGALWSTTTQSPVPNPRSPVPNPRSPIAILADIRFPERIRQIFEEVRPQIVFHAAAHKHVPLMEANPAEAITNNVLGTRNLVAAALAADVERFVMISTDKAVNPTRIMGASKRAAELIVHEAARKTGKPFVAVRFGNVLGSRGSVVLTFKQQIAAGGPVTVTHPSNSQ